MNFSKRPTIHTIVCVMAATAAALVLTQGWALSGRHAVVNTLYGKLRGYVSDDVVIWKGVPYAKPPAGDLRWKAPQDPDHWIGVRDATVPAGKCTQLQMTRE